MKILYLFKRLFRKTPQQPYYYLFILLETPKSPKSPKSPKGKSAPSVPLNDLSPVRPSSPVETVGVVNGTVNVDGTVELTEDQLIEQKRQLLMKGMLKGNKKKPTKAET